MDGRLVPEGYGVLHPFLRNMFENVAAVQFDHRLLATLTATISLVAAATGLWSARGGVRTAMAVLGAAVIVQYALGVTTLLWVVPVSLGTAHQAMAMLALTAALVALHLQSRGRQPRAAPGRT
jgi:cytochrome c oxidase assembly protein subunit 15